MNGGDERAFVTNDLSLAAFMSMHGLPLSKAARDDRSGIYEFRFRDHDARAETLKLQFANSCCAQFEAAIRRLKNILHSGTQQRGRPRE